MITTDFSNYILTKSERKLLKKIKRGKVAVYCDYFQDLLNQNFICYQQYGTDEIGNHIPQDNKIMITELGKAFLKWKKRDNIRFWFPVVISIIALAISALALA
jgi:hypothetical protein